MANFRTQQRRPGTPPGFPQARYPLARANTSGIPELEVVKTFVLDNKWYFLGGGLLLAGAIAWHKR